MRAEDALAARNDAALLEAVKALVDGLAPGRLRTAGEEILARRAAFNPDDWYKRVEEWLADIRRSWGLPPRREGWWRSGI